MKKTLPAWKRGRRRLTGEPPLTKDVKIKCFGCGKKIEPMEKNSKSRANCDMWNDGLVHDVTAGFGSKHDCDGFIIGICDECIDDAMKDGRLIQFRSLTDWIYETEERAEKRSKRKK